MLLLFTDTFIFFLLTVRKMLTISLIELIIVFHAGLELNHPEEVFYFPHVLQLAGLTSILSSSERILWYILFSQLTDEHALKNVKNYNQ